MTGPIRVAPGPVPAHWTVAVPGSKSLTNRALLLAAVADGRSRLREPLRSDDTAAMLDAVRALGVSVADAPGELTIDGLGGGPTGGEPDAGTDIWCGMAGTVGRFLVPVLTTGRGRFEVRADPQLARRPIGPVLDALRDQGAQIAGDRFPLTIDAHGLRGGVVDVDASVSGQFLSGLLLAAPLAAAPLSLRFGAVASWPYIELTLAAMRSFGVEVAPGPELAGRRELRVPCGPYRAADITIEPDASTASYFLAAAALTGSTVTVPGVDRAASGQGDFRFADHLAAMGATVRDDAGEESGPAALELTGPRQLRGVHVDMEQCPDVSMTLACLAPFADAPTTIEGIGNVRVKESDRIAATAENLRRLGITVDEGPDHLVVQPGTPHPARLPTFDDHRIAMAFAVIGLRTPVMLEDPGVVAKTCPEFFDLFAASGAAITTAAIDAAGAG